MTKGKGLIRSHTRKGTRSGKTMPGATTIKPLHEPTCCERCGAVFSRQSWRKDRRLTHAMLGRANWTVCPACRQTVRSEYCGRVLIRGAYAAANEVAIRQRIRNVAARAQFTQPERRVVSAERAGNVLEVLTTSQKLAHRIVHELKKAFRGRAAYNWSDEDGSLLATWERNDVPAGS